MQSTAELCAKTRAARAARLCFIFENHIENHTIVLNSYSYRRRHFFSSLLLLSVR